MTSWWLLLCTCHPTQEITCHLQTQIKVQWAPRLCTLKIPSVAAVSSELCSLRVGIIMKPLLRQNYFIPVFDVLYFFEITCHLQTQIKSYLHIYLQKLFTLPMLIVITQPGKRLFLPLWSTWYFRFQPGARAGETASWIFKYPQSDERNDWGYARLGIWGY
jgi:hypothetical protein